MPKSAVENHHSSCRFVRLCSKIVGFQECPPWPSHRQHERLHLPWKIGAKRILWHQRPAFCWCAAFMPSASVRTFNEQNEITKLSKIRNGCLGGCLARVEQFWKVFLQMSRAVVWISISSISPRNIDTTLKLSKMWSLGCIYPSKVGKVLIGYLFQAWTGHNNNFVVVKSDPPRTALSRLFEYLGRSYRHDCRVQALVFNSQP